MRVLWPKFILFVCQRCIICKQTYGSCTQCCKCATYFHATCASRAGYFMEVGFSELFLILMNNIFFSCCSVWISYFVLCYTFMGASTCQYCFLCSLCSFSIENYTRIEYQLFMLMLNRELSVELHREEWYASHRKVNILCCSPVRAFNPIDHLYLQYHIVFSLNRKRESCGSFVHPSNLYIVSPYLCSVAGSQTQILF